MSTIQKQRSNLTGGIESQEKLQATVTTQNIIRAEITPENNLQAKIESKDILRATVNYSERTLNASIVAGKTLNGKMSKPAVIGGVTDYEDLDSLPKINGVTVIGDKKSTDYGLQDALLEFSTTEIIEIWNTIIK